MPQHWERYLKRWLEAGLIDADAAEGISAFEAGQAVLPGWRWPVVLAASLGGLLVGAGILLFVAAHWDRLSPEVRFGLVVLLVAFFHVAGALLAERSPALATAMHGVGTVCLGAGVFLVGQVFHLQEHWPSGVLLWALGAWVAWALLGDWPQTILVALLTPLWLSSEWLQAAGGGGNSVLILTQGLLLLAISYFTALTPGKETTIRKTLAWLGGLALLPAVLAVIISGDLFSFRSHSPVPVSQILTLLGWTAALLLPLGLAWIWRGLDVWQNLLAVLWVVLLGLIPKSPFDHGGRVLMVYVLCALGAIGLIAWGWREARRERLYLGLAGFALTVVCFYFANVMDKLGRAASLLGLGVLFLAGGWSLEQARRRLLASLNQGQSCNLGSKVS